MAHRSSRSGNLLVISTSGGGTNIAEWMPTKRSQRFRSDVAGRKSSAIGCVDGGIETSSTACPESASCLTGIKQVRIATSMEWTSSNPIWCGPAQPTDVGARSDKIWRELVTSSRCSAGAVGVRRNQAGVKESMIGYVGQLVNLVEGGPGHEPD